MINSADHEIVNRYDITCKMYTYFCSLLVEFPAVLLNTSSGEVESEFHHYVQPQEQPTLSAFCTELTGITQVTGEFLIPRIFCFLKYLQ